MRRALELARRGWGRVHPNPLVGAVVVREGRIVGEGWHAEYGGPHAEVVALQAAGEAARGATLYVTLEPCAHHGRTPPCTRAVIDAGVATVVFAAADPNPKAAGGSAALREHGVEVRTDVERDAARALNAAFFHVHEGGAPFVALKLALSLDGRIAARRGERTTLSGPEAQQAVHRLRTGFDAILIGRGTAETDDPLLTVRLAEARTPPVRIVADTDLRLNPGSQLVRTVREAPLWILAAEPAHDVEWLPERAAAWPDRRAALERAGARILVTEPGEGGIALSGALRQLADEGVRTLLVEGGAALATSLLAGDLVHRLHLVVSPAFLGRQGLPAFDVAEPPGRGWRFTHQETFGSDVWLTLDRREDD